jgi:hypothetical protein
MANVDTKQAIEILRECGLTVTYTTLATWLQKGLIVGARHAPTPRGPVWEIPEKALREFQPPPRGWPKGKVRKPEIALMDN